MRILEVRGLTKTFGAVRAVDDVSFTVDAGELLALIGPNGAGKTTCFNCLNGQIRPDRGTVRVGGLEVTGLPPRQVFAHGVARTFQVTRTFASLTVLDNVRAALLARHRRTFGLFRLASRDFRTEAIAILDEVGCTDLTRRIAGTLAYGDLKRVELGVALAGAPRLLLMDEPTAGMAAEERGAMMGLVARLVGERRLAVLFTEHDMEVVFGHADRILVLNEGRKLADGPPDAVQKDPHVREIYLGSGGLLARGLDPAPFAAVES